MAKQHLSLKMYKENPTLEDKISDHDLLHWIMKNSTNILAGTALLLALLFFLYRMSANEKVKAENDYYTATKEYIAFLGQGESTPLTEEQAFVQLEEILNRRPELQSKYDAMIAQTFLVRENPEAAHPFAKRTFARTSQDHLPLYQRFAEITLLISEQNYPQALHETKELKEQLLQEEANQSSSLLQVYNLLRLALLEQALDHKEGEIAAWKTLDETLYSTDPLLSTKHATLKMEMEKVFSDGTLSLKNYSDHRQKLLSRE